MILPPKRAASATEAGSPVKKLKGRDGRELILGNEPVDGSCGCPIVDAGGRVIGIFMFKDADSNMCLCVSSIELRELGYEICGEEQSFK